MLRIEHQRAGSREVESGGDSPFCRSQRSPGVDLNSSKTQKSARTLRHLALGSSWVKAGMGFSPWRSGEICGFYSRSPQNNKGHLVLLVDPTR